AGRALTRAEVGALAGDGPWPVGLETDVVGAWDFSADIATERMADSSPNRLDGETVNLPARAVTGHNWTGAEMDWKRAPGQYGAIHFDSDDLADPRPQTDFTLPLPAHFRTRLY